MRLSGIRGYGFMKILTCQLPVISICIVMMQAKRLSIGLLFRQEQPIRILVRSIPRKKSPSGDGMRWKKSHAPHSGYDWSAEICKGAAAVSDKDLRYVRATGLFIIVAVFTPLLRQRLRAGSNTGNIRVLIAGLHLCIGFVLLGLDSAGSLSFLFLLPLFLLLTFLEGTP